MSDVFDTTFGLLAGFGYAHIMILGLIVALIGSIVSAAIWLARRQVLKSLPGAAFVLVAIPMAIGIIPGLERAGQPFALVLLALAFFNHFNAWGEKNLIDRILTIMLGAALLALVFVVILSSLSRSPVES